jgi:phosphohistidine swiveling domain-containing protein
MLILEKSSGETVAKGQVGGKAAGLLLLQRVGARVPPFYVLPTECFRAHLRREDVVGDVGEALLLFAETREPREAQVALVEVARRLQTAIEKVEPAEEVRCAVADALADLGPGPYAVRSSMVGEDSADHSFAGQLHTGLFQHTLAQVLACVRSCWSSAFQPAALAYAARAGISPADVHLAVVIQVMIDADISGVVFSANPVTGARDECLLSAAYGLGEGVVADSAPADTYIWSPESGERSVTVAHKSARVAASPSGHGTALQQVPAEARDRRALAVDRVAEVGALALDAADAAGRPIDVEWCLAGGVLYALQARPVTSLAPERREDEPVYVFDNANIQESFNGVTTPLTFSFAARVYESVYSTMLGALGASGRVREELAPAARSLLAFIDGRIYYNLESWRQLLQVLPAGSRRVQDVETIMFRTTIGAAAHTRVSVWSRLRRGLEAARMARRLLLLLARQDAEVERYIERADRFHDSVDRERLAHMSLEELGVLLRRLQAETVIPAAPAYLNDLRVAIMSGRLRKLVADVYGEDQADARLADLLSGIAGLESVEPVRQLIAIAEEVRGEEALAAELQRTAPAEVVAVMRERSPVLASRIDAFIERYGDRTIGELKLETVSVQQDKRLLGEVIVNCLRGGGFDPDAAHRVERERATRARRELAGRLSLSRQLALRLEVGLARKSLSCRERLRLRRTHGFACAREAYLALGARLHLTGTIAHPRDVMYLTVEEIDSFLEGRAVSADLDAIVAARRSEFHRYAHADAPHRLRTTGTPYLGLRDEPAQAGEDGVKIDDPAAPLRGLGCCAGVVQASVRVIHDPGESLSLNGEILCTVRTDPGWALLFASARGLLVERGSMLSHSAVVARELGIPTVVGVDGVTRILKDGDVVRLDGGKGVVERVISAREG